MLAPMSGIDQLLTLARVYAAAEGVGLTTVSARVFDDGKKLSAIEHGADIQVRRYEKALRWFAQNWPAEAQWPSEIERPALEDAQ